MTTSDRKFHDTYGHSVSSPPSILTTPPKESVEEQVRTDSWKKRLMGVIFALLLGLALFFGLAIFLIVGIVSFLMLWITRMLRPSARSSSRDLTR